MDFYEELEEELDSQISKKIYRSFLVESFGVIFLFGPLLNSFHLERITLAVILMLGAIVIFAAGLFMIFLHNDSALPVVLYTACVAKIVAFLMAGFGQGMLWPALVVLLGEAAGLAVFLLIFMQDAATDLGVRFVTHIAPVVICEFLLIAFIFPISF